MRMDQRAFSLVHEHPNISLSLLGQFDTCGFAPGGERTNMGIRHCTWGYKHARGHYHSIAGLSAYPHMCIDAFQVVRTHLYIWERT